MELDFPPVKLEEWDSCMRADVQLSADDRILAKQLLQTGQGRLLVEELRSGVRFVSYSWVGVVRFSRFEVRILPKLAGDNLGLVEMLEFTSRLNALRRCSNFRKLAADGTDLLDLLILLLSEECERIVQAGMISGYVEQEDELPVVRGRLLADRQWLQRFGRVDRVICRFDEHEQDVPENQLLAFALDLCSRIATNGTIRRRTRQLGNVINAVCDKFALNLDSARHEIVYDRLNEHYQSAHELVWLILDGLGVRDLFTTGNARVFSFLLDMNRLFEAFVREVLTRLLDKTGLGLDYLHSERSIIVRAGTHQTYSRVIPDFLVLQRNTAVPQAVVDAKYKLYDSIRVSNADIYQSFLYAYAFSPLLANAQAGLIFPATTPSGSYDELLVRSTNSLTRAKVCLIGLPIPAVLAEMNKKTAVVTPETPWKAAIMNLVGLI